MKILLVFCLLATMLKQNSYAQEPLKKFLTDYCTAYHEGTRARPDVWKHCCMEHDLYFWAGGSMNDRKDADLRLSRCVEATGELVQARLMYAAVAIGNYSPIKFTAQQFGNGWPKSRPRYQSLSAEETEMILNEIDTNTRWLPESLRESFKHQLNSRLGNQ